MVVFVYSADSMVECVLSPLCMSGLGSGECTISWSSCCDNLIAGKFGEGKHFLLLVVLGSCCMSYRYILQG